MLRYVSARTASSSDGTAAEPGMRACAQSSSRVPEPRTRPLLSRTKRSHTRAASAI